MLEKQEPTEAIATLLERVESSCDETCEASVEQAITLLEQFCVHLPEFQSTGADPVERLKLLRLNLPETKLGFYRALLSIFAEFGDRHTSCFMPEPLAESVAFLPFLVREYFEEGEQRVSIIASATDELLRGDTLVSWNDTSLSSVLKQHMALQLGANSEARRAKAVQTLTFRSLACLPAPEETVVLVCLGQDGQRRKVRLAWQVAEAAWLTRHFSSLLQVKEGSENFSTDNLRARLVETSFGTFGCIRVASFQEHPDSFLRSFMRALESMPKAGLILDLRGCEEGIIPTAERVLQLFTTGTVEPQPFQFRITKLIRHLVQNCPALQEWRDPVERAAARGEFYSEWRSLTSTEEANSIGQRYQGPVVLLVDALTFSSAEMFAAGFQDHGAGVVLGTAPCTGGGGASAWSQATIFRLSEMEAFRPLPRAPRFRVAVRRCRRVRAMSGQPLEGVGVKPDALHLPTRTDLFNEDADLFESVAKILAENRNRRYI